MLLRLLKAKIHRARLTMTDLHYEGSIGIDEDILDAASILPHEEVAVWNVTNGERLVTYALPAARGSREFMLNGPPRAKPRLAISSSSPPLRKCPPKKQKHSSRRLS